MRWPWIALFLVLTLFLVQSDDRTPRVVPVPPGADDLMASLTQVAADLVRQSPETITARGIAAQLELFAEELRLAQAALSEITGEFTADDLLGEIFSHFCIGK